MLMLKPNIAKAMRSRWLAVSVHAGLWLVLYLALTHLGGKAFDSREADSGVAPAPCPVPVARLNGLFSLGGWPKALGGTNGLNPFATRHFIPQQAPPPTTRKIEVTYQGFYQAGDGPKQAIFKLGEAFVTAPIGAKVATNLFVAAATMQELTLTNQAAQTNLVPLNVKKAIEVPIQ
jgi:hypothetical protein